MKSLSRVAGRRICRHYWGEILSLPPGGYAMATALWACGVGHGDRLTNVSPSRPVPLPLSGRAADLCGVTEDLVIDLDDLAAKLDQSSVLLLHA
jgi:hypothetical protein